MPSGFQNLTLYLNEDHINISNPLLFKTLIEGESRNSKSSYKSRPQNGRLLITSQYRL